MLEVGLIGAPGTGKSAAAVAVANRLSLDVVSPPAAMVELSGRAVGTQADYIVNLEIAMLRHHQIESQRHGSRPFVAEGTLIESLAYAGMRVEDLQVEVPTGVLRNQMLREMHTATLIGCMMIDVQSDKNLYYLPLPLPGPNRIDDTIQDVIKTYNVPVTVVTGDNQAELIITHILGSETNDS